MDAPNTNYSVAAEGDYLAQHRANLEYQERLLHDQEDVLRWMAYLADIQRARLSPPGPATELHREIRRDMATYPRPHWFRILRRVLIYWWVILVAYVSNVLFNLYGLIEHAGPNGTLTVPSILQALYIDQVARLTQHPWVTIPLTLLLIGFTVAGIWARRDRKREAKVALLKVFAPEQVAVLEDVFPQASRPLDPWSQRWPYFGQRGSPSAGSSATPSAQETPRRQ